MERVSQAQSNAGRSSLILEKVVFEAFCDFIQQASHLILNLFPEAAKLLGEKLYFKVRVYKETHRYTHKSLWV